LARWNGGVGRLVGASLLLLACAGRTEVSGTGSGGGAGFGGSGNTGGGAGGTGGVGALGGSTCVTAEGVRFCGGKQAECGWLDATQCPGGGCAAPYDRELGGDAVAGLCFSDLPDKAIRSCQMCNDGEVCLERKPGQLYCVPEGVCARLWLLGARGVCRYADLGAYDARPLSVLAACPGAAPSARLCGGPCEEHCVGSPCTGRSPDHPQGFCPATDDEWCALSGSDYVYQCSTAFAVCGFFRHAGAANQSAARQYGQCFWKSQCLALAKGLPGGFECYDAEGKLLSE
jgi:hypothetical protein